MVSAASHVHSGDIEIASLLRAVNRRKTVIFALAALVAGLTYVSLTFVAPIYSSQARILIEREENSYKRPAGSQISSDRRSLTDQEAVASQVQVMLSRDLAAGVVSELQLENNPEFTSDSGLGRVLRSVFQSIGLKSPDSKTVLQERIIDKFIDRLTVYQIEKSRVIAVEFNSEDAQLAARAANRLADVYLTWQQGEKLKQTREARTWLSAQIEELREKVKETDTAAESFRSSSGLLEGSNKTTLDAQQLSELNSQLILAKAQRTEKEARANLILKMLKEQGGVAGAADVLNSPLIQRLLEQRVRVQRQLAEVSATLLPSHPRVRQLNSELADLRRQIRQEARKVVTSLQNEAQIAGAREKSLRDSLAELKVSASKGNENQIKLRALEREAKANRELLESYLARFRDASARSVEASVPSHATIISRAHASNKPSFPQKGPITFLAFAAVALLGLAHTVARELIAPSGAGFGSVPWSNESGQAIATSPARSLPSTREIAQMLLDGESGRIFINTPGASSRSSSDVLQLAREVSHSGLKTILVDATMQGDHLAIEMEAPDEPGLYQFLNGEAGFEHVIRPDEDSELHVITGNTEPTRVHSMKADAIEEMMLALEDAYDLVLVYSEAEILTQLCQLHSSRHARLLVAAGEARSEDHLSWAKRTILGGNRNGIDALACRTGDGWRSRLAGLRV